VARLDDVTLANVDLQLHVNVSINRPPDRTWRRPPGRPRNKWLTGYETIPHVRLETSGGVLSTVNMVVQRRDSPLWLRELDDDDDDSQFPFLAFSAFPPSPVWPGAWRSGRALDRLATPKVAGSTPCLALSTNNLGQVVHRRVRASVTKQYNLVPVKGR